MREIEWEIIRIRSKGEYVGRIAAPDERGALSAIVKLLRLKSWDEKRLVVRRAG